MTSGFMTSSSRPPMSTSVLMAMSWDGGVWVGAAGMGVGVAVEGACLGCWTGPSCLVTCWQPLPSLSFAQDYKLSLQHEHIHASGS